MNIFLALLNGVYEIYVTTDILLEYEEIITTKNGSEIARAVLELLIGLTNIHFVRKYFHWNMITADPDDNKFTDCAVAANVDYVVSDDSHFKEVKKIDFPEVRVIGKRKFRELLGLPD